MGSFNANLSVVPYLQVANQELPDGEGPRAVPVNLDFNAAAAYSLDLSQLEQQGRFSMLQTVFIDTKDTDAGLTLTVSGTGQVVKVKGRTQGYYPVLATNPTKLIFTSAAGIIIPIILINVPIQGCQWPTQ